MNAPRLSSRLRQQGMVTVMAVIFLITAVIFVLSQTLGISGSNSIDNKQQLDSVAALFLAESGLERGQGILTAANPLITNTVCTGIAGGYSLGRGTVTLSATSTPLSCDSSGPTPCDSCVIHATGNVESASRTLTRTMSLPIVNGTAGVGTNVSMTLKNTSSHPAVALFNLAPRRQGNHTDAICNSVNGIICTMKWNVESQNGGGVPSVGGMGVAVTIPASTDATIIQTLDTSRSYAEVGALFPGSSAPSVVGAYWDDSNGGGGKTVGKNTTTGETNDGAACLPTAPVSASCPAPTNPPSPIPNQGSIQASRSWCYGADTLVFGFSGRSSALGDIALDSVIFDTATASRQNIPLLPIAHFPDASFTSAPGDVYADVWYVHNPDYLSASDASSGGVVTGTIGVALFAATQTNGSNVMNVTSISGTGAVLHVGDSVTCTTGGPCPTFLPATITGQTSGTTGSTGNYTLSANSNCSSPSQCIRNFKTSSSILEVTLVSSGYLSIGDTITGGASGTITSITGAGNVIGPYGISTAQNVSSTTITAEGATIHVSAGVPPGNIPKPGTIVAVRSVLTGQFAKNTTVLSTPAPTETSFKVSAVPSTRLSNAQACGGICAFFDHTTSSSHTSFQFAKNSGMATGHWSAGFLCLSGADITPIRVNSSTVNAGTWSEVVQ